MNEMQAKSDKTILVFWRVVFAASALWTFVGAVPGFFAPDFAFAAFYGGATGGGGPTALELELFRGGWGQSLLFGIGYVFAAINPWRHWLVVALGGLGKVFYAVRLVGTVAAGEGSATAVLAIVGDFLFVSAFACYLLWIIRRERGGHSRGPRLAEAPQ